MAGSTETCWVAYLEVAVDALAALAWPLVVVIIAAMFRNELKDVAARLRQMSGPGFNLDLSKEIERAEGLSERVEDARAARTSQSGEVSTEMQDPNSQMLARGLVVSPSNLDMSFYRDLIETADPNIAMAGLRIEVEKLARNVAKGFGIEIAAYSSVTQILNRLRAEDAITSDQHSLARAIVQLCNRAVHGESISATQANQVIDLAEVLADQYLAWLKWGFGNVDPDGSESVEPS